MRKLFLGLAALMLSMTVLAERVSQEDAALVANNFMNVGNTVSGVQKAPAKKMFSKKQPQLQRISIMCTRMQMAKAGSW